MKALVFSVATLISCNTASHVDESGKYPTLFPQTPLSEAPCLEDQDCVVTHLRVGQCCPDPITEASNLFSKDQYEKLVAHQRVVCNDKTETYTCPEPPAPGHIEFVYQGACVEQRCVKKKVPADAPHTPPQSQPKTQEQTEAEAATSTAVETAPETTTIETAASPKAD